MSYGINAPVGLVPMMRRGGSTADVYTQYPLGATSKDVLFKGDLVTIDQFGNLRRFDPIKFDSTQVRTSIPIGVFQGCTYLVSPSQNPTNMYQMNNMWPGYTNINFFGQPNAIGYVIDDPMCIYDIQANNTSGMFPGDGTTSGTTTATTGASATVVMNTGDPILGISGMVLDLNTHKPENDLTAKTENYPLKIIGVTQVPGNVYGIPFMNFQVSINYGVYSAGQLGV